MVAQSPHAEQPTDQQQQLNTLPAKAHSNTIHSRSQNVRQYPTFTRPPTPTPLLSVASSTDAAGVDSATTRVKPHSNFFLEEQSAARAATLAATGKSRPRKGQPQVQVQYPQGLSPIPIRRQDAEGTGTNGMSSR